MITKALVFTAAICAVFAVTTSDVFAWGCSRSSSGSSSWGGSYLPQQFHLGRRWELLALRLRQLYDRQRQYLQHQPFRLRQLWLWRSDLSRHYFRRSQLRRVASITPAAMEPFTTADAIAPVTARRFIILLSPRLVLPSRRRFTIPTLHSPPASIVARWSGGKWQAPIGSTRQPAIHDETKKQSS